VLNCIHGAKHFWERLMWPADIAAIVARHPEIAWERVRQAARSVGCGEADVARGPAVERITAGRCDARRKWLQARIPMARRANWCGRSRAGCRPRATCHQLCYKERMFRLKMGGGGRPGSLTWYDCAFSDRGRWAEGTEEARVRVCGRRSRGRFG